MKPENIDMEEGQKLNTMVLLPDSSSSSESSQCEEKEREKWGGKVDSMLSFLGYAVGLGNLWRFPYLCMRNGGGAFLIPFLFFLICCGLPLYFLELCLGQFSGKSASHAWEVCPLFRGVGVGMVVCISVIGLYYNIIIAWTLYYIGSSFISPLPWRSCTNEWNTPNCITDRGNTSQLINASSAVNFTSNILGGNETAYWLNTVNATSPVGWNNLKTISDNTTSEWLTSEEEFWQYRVLRMSSGLEEIGTIPWHLAVCFFAAWVFIYLCLVKGVKSIGKVVWVTATLPYILLTIILIRGATLPGAAEGILFYLTPDFKRLMDVQVWIEAAVQVFYSLGPAWGPMITMASYNKFNNNCYRDAILLTFASEGTSIFGGFVVFSVLGFMAHKANLPIEKIVKSGPGLGFVVYPEAISMLPIPNLWAVLFFLMLLTVGLDSQFAHIESVCTAIIDSFPTLRKRRAFFTAIVCAICFLLGLVMCSQGGIYAFQLVDWYVASISLPLFGLLECIIFAWIYGAEQFSRDVQIMLNRSVPVFMRICWCIVTPLVLLSLLLFTLATYSPPTYGDYIYPSYTTAVGWFLALIPIVPLPLFAALTIKRSPGMNFPEKLNNSLKPSRHWKPASREHAKTYDVEERCINGTFLQKVKLNLFGQR